MSRSPRFALSRAAVIGTGIAALTVTTAAAAPARRTSLPQNTAPPAISGVTQAGQTLTATPGTWDATPPATFTFTWQRCDAQGADCRDISGIGNTTTYTLGSVDVGSRLRVVVTATNATGSVSAASTPTQVIQPAPVGAPANTAPPTITGTASTGQTLTATPGTWSGNQPITYAYQWFRCDPNGAACQPIAGATGATYTLADQDAGITLRVVSIATNGAGNASAVSVPTARVAKGPIGAIDVSGGRSIPVTSVELPTRLVIDKVTSSPRVLSSRAPFRFTVRVKDTRGFYVRDALVRILGVPYSRVANAPERRTGQDGSVTFTVRPLPGLELGRGKYLVFSVRARSPEGSLLAGVSTRRLVQLRTGPAA